MHLIPLAAVGRHKSMMPKVVLVGGKISVNRFTRSNQDDVSAKALSKVFVLFYGNHKNKSSSNGVSAQRFD